jgi:hypothetical protein
MSHVHLLSLCEQGPRSRSYGRTAVLRLTEETCDKDEEKDDQFFIFPSNGAPVEYIGSGKPKYSAKNLSQCHFVQHKSHMDMLTYLHGIINFRLLTTRISVTNLLL